MKKEIERYLIKARLKEIKSDMSLIETTLSIVEFAELQQSWWYKDKLRFKKLEKEQKTLQEALNV